MTSKVWITADWHFNHVGINKSTSKWTKSTPSRDFPTIDDMNDRIIDNINAVVDRKDTLWNLGDVIFGRIRSLPKLRSRINCRDIRLILGNHDKSIKEHRINDAGKRVPGNELGKCFSDVRYYRSIKHFDKKIYLFHCPMHTWPGINRGIIQLHGHCHANLPDRGLRQMDVGVDTNDFKPYLLDDVVDMMLDRAYEDCPDIPQDHHA